MEKNYGVILGQRPEDYIAGASPIKYEERNPSGNWKPYLPAEERQYSRNADTMACVSFSALNSVEIQIKFLMGIQENLSDRFLAKMSGTTKEGNYLYKVGDTLRKQGCVAEQYWPAPKDFTWDEYYIEIPLPIRTEALALLNKYDIMYEWVTDLSLASLKKELKQSPLQVVIPGHAVTLVTCEGDLQYYFDSYAPYLKQYGSPFQAAMKYVVTLRTDKMSAEEVKLQYSLSFYRQPTADELAYWTGKSLIDFLKTAVRDRALFLNAQVVGPING